MKITAAAALALLASANAQTIVEVATSTGNHNTLVSVVEQAGLVDTLSGEGPLTVFAPTDAAFSALPSGASKFTSEEWHGHLTDILTHHVVEGKVMSTDLVVDDPITMVNGGTTTITSLDPPTINDALIEPADVEASNGVVHVIDKVLLPPSTNQDIADLAQADDRFSTLVAAAIAAEIAESFAGTGPFTVFAPTNDAFRNMDGETLQWLLGPEGKDELVKVLNYHFFPGLIYQEDLVAGNLTMGSTETATITLEPSLMIDYADIQAPQILASNGIMHPINQVLIPPSSDLPTPAPLTPEPTNAPTAAPVAATDAPAPAPVSGGTTHNNLGFMMAATVASAMLFLLA